MTLSRIAGLLAAPAREGGDAGEILRLHPARALLTPVDAYGWTALARNLLPLLFLLWLAPYVAGPPWHAAALMPLVGLFVYRLTFILHDCAHGTLFRSRGLNRTVGGWTGAVVGIDFALYRRLHFLHHHRYGHPRDPQGLHYLGLAHAGRGQLIVHLLKPLVGALTPTLFRETAAQVARSDRSALGRLAVVQSALLLLVTGLGKSPALALLPLASAATFGLFFSQLRGFAEHVAFAGERPEGTVRSHRPNPLDRLLLYDLNFNYHTEHHLFPHVPSAHLPRLSSWRAATGAGEHEVSSSMWRTIGRRLAGA